MTRNFFIHLRPVRVPEETLRLTLSWGLGGMAVVLVVIQLVTGLMLQFHYAPTPMDAYSAVRRVVSEVPYGRMVRNMHYLGANFLVVVMFLHMLRVMLTGAFHGSRRLNWIVGLGMFSFVLCANFTGYLLPWDQLAFWAVTVSTGMLEYIPWIGTGIQGIVLGGPDMGPQTLLIFHSLHTAVLPVLLFGFMGFHFWRVRKAGGLANSKASPQGSSGADSRVSAMPHLFVREGALALAVLAAVILAAVFVDAPLGDPANPGLSPNPAKAPWYFAGFQEILLHVHPVYAVFVIPLTLGAGLMMAPYVRHDLVRPGVWFLSEKGRKMAGIAVPAGLAVATGFVLLSESGLLPSHGGDGRLSIIRAGVVPVLFFFVLPAFFYMTVKKGVQASRSESLQSLFVFAAVVLLVLTITGAWLRGPEMALMLLK